MILWCWSFQLYQPVWPVALHGHRQPSEIDAFPATSSDNFTSEQEIEVIRQCATGIFSLDLQERFNIDPQATRNIIHRRLDLFNAYKQIHNMLCNEKEFDSMSVLSMDTVDPYKEITEATGLALVKAAFEQYCQLGEFHNYYVCRERGCSELSRSEQEIQKSKRDRYEVLQCLPAWRSQSRLNFAQLRYNSIWQRNVVKTL